ncbi:hypothetical protein BROUX41_006138 [Berkeleyomyces rouxiae]|uniref:uncharacterized protein n=1 Tax=Berkeleyomyces rouxiae TaxID=2035830 RepID=UPI003B7C283F
MRFSLAVIMAASTAFAAPPAPMIPGPFDAPLIPIETESSPEVPPVALTARTEFIATVPPAPVGSNSAKVAGPSTHVIFIRDEQIIPFDIKAAAGDVVRFEFGPGSQAIVEGELDIPCHPKAGGYASGTFTTPVDERRNKEGYEIEIKDGRPIWFYSAIDGVCNKNGAVGVINAPNTLEENIIQYIINARRATETKNADINGGKVVPVQVKPRGKTPQ